MALPAFYQRYVDNFEGESLIRGMIAAGDECLDFYKTIGPGAYDFSYAPGKWTIREILGHVMDSERIFAYRALRFARNDKTELPGFDHETYINGLNLNKRPMNALITEYANLRASTIDLFSGFSEIQLQNSGTASEISVTVEELGKILVGHEIHHRKILLERYLA